MSEHDITVVTAFFDIGRGNLSKIRRPHIVPALQDRSVDTYFEYFTHLAKLQNQLIVYTTEEFADRVREIRKRNSLLGETVVVVLPSYLPKEFEQIRGRIDQIMSMPEYYQRVANPGLIEYWYSDYVLVNLLKSFYVTHAIDHGLIGTDLVAWIDFGYCRSSSTIPEPRKWAYGFDSSKIHLFYIREIEPQRPIESIVYTGDVYIQGSHIVAGTAMWPRLQELMFRNLTLLLNRNLIDDDQTLLLMSYLSDKDIFELRYCHPTDWFIIFKMFNELQYHVPTTTE